MFKNIFSFNGRIRRTEFGISYIIYFVIYLIMLYIQNAERELAIFILLGFISLIWFLWAQGAKRCHDIGKSGWWQIIPFYFLWMLFQDGYPGENEYGDDPKNRVEFSADDYVSPPPMINGPERPADDEQNPAINS